MEQNRRLSRRRFLQTVAATGALAAVDLARQEPFLSPRKAFGAVPVRFQFSVPEPPPHSSSRRNPPTPPGLPRQGDLAWRPVLC